MNLACAGCAQPASIMGFKPFRALKDNLGLSQRVGLKADLRVLDPSGADIQKDDPTYFD
ncbi:MAG: hypothetical protein ACUVSD_05595 [Thiobacillaceae bacterium]